ncbi:MAG: BamA/TamA family outer membrane protein [Longimicrobiales bacterium]|nr:BamA/TamA family outer membrane protein [Longimicrobiales bacterium]
MPLTPPAPSLPEPPRAHSPILCRARAAVLAACAWAPLGLWASAGLGLPVDLVAQEQPCGTGIISDIFIDNHSVFDTSEIDGDDSFQWAYELANTLHYDTRSSFVRSELLFAEGDCLDPFLLQESERILRNYDFLAEVDIAETRQANGTYHVVVDTRDEWTTKASLGVAFEDGFRFEGVELTEENVAGRGILANVHYRERREVRDLGGELWVPRIAATRTNLSLTLGRTRIGTFFSQGLFYPFVGEVGLAAGKQTYARRETLFPYAVPSDSSVFNVLLPYEEEAIEVTGAARLGEPGNLTIFGVGLLRESMLFPGFPGSVEMSEGGNYSAASPADSARTAALDPHIRPLTIFRLNFLLGQRNVRFVQRRGLDALDGVQDVQLGTEVALTLGRAVGDLGSGSRAAPDDLYARFYGFGGWAPGDFLLAINTDVEGRVLLRDDQPGDATLRDLLGEVDLYGYWQPDGPGGRTLFGRISGAGGWEVRRPYQLTLGGRTGVRGYRELDFPGARRVVLTVEDRRPYSWPLPELMDFGTTLFADVGRIWSGDVPFGQTSAWQASVGAGLRLGFPTGTRSVFRIDLALPVTGPRAWSSPVFRMSLREVIGLIRGFRDEEVVRSRRPAVGTDLLTEENR